MANPLDGFKKLPTWGKIAVGVGGVGVAYVMYMRHQASAAAATTSTATSTGTDPVTGLPYSQDNTVDPQTGMTYLAEAQQYGSVSAAESAVAGGASYGYGGYGASTSGYPVTGYYDNSGTTLGTTTGYGTNAQWAQAAESGLASIGYTETDVAAALGRYLAGLSLTSDQATIVYAALGEYGNPPVGSFSVILAPSTGPSSTGNGSTSTGNGSTSTGNGSTSTAQATTSGGHVVSVNNNDAVVAWTGHNAVRYTTVIQGPGPINGHKGSTTVPQATFSGLSAGHDYVVTVTPYNSAGQAGEPGTINLVTK
jgi:hypothetical protein